MYVCIYVLMYYLLILNLHLLFEIIDNCMYNYLRFHLDHILNLVLKNFAKIHKV